MHRRTRLRAGRAHYLRAFHPNQSPIPGPSTRARIRRAYTGRGAAAPAARPASADHPPPGERTIDTDSTGHRSDRRVVLITGAARRIGAAIARELHAAGCNLVLHYRSSEAETTALRESLETARAGSTLAVRADLADRARLPRLVDAGVERFGRLDGLVNNASAFFATPLGAIAGPALDELFAVNVAAPLLLAQAAAPHLRRSGGAIVNLTDIYAERPKPGFLAYSATRAALSALTVGLAAELAPEVRVNAVAPGAILWPETAGADAERDAIVQRIPLGRTGTAQEVARAVAALLLELGYVTGQVLRVDGGRTASL